MRIRKGTPEEMEKPVKAVIGADEASLFLFTPDGVKFITQGCVSRAKEQTLEEVLSNPHRTPIYAGETIILEF